MLIRWRLQQADSEHALDIQENRNQPARNPQGLMRIEHPNFCYSNAVTQIKYCRNHSLHTPRDGPESRFKSFNYKFRVSLVSAKCGPKLTIYLQSVTTRKGGSGPNRFHYDRWALSRRTLLVGFEPRPQRIRHTAPRKCHALPDFSSRHTSKGESSNHIVIGYVLIYIQVLT
jgi:hypothetical protein